MITRAALFFNNRKLQTFKALNKGGITNNKRKNKCQLNGKVAVWSSEDAVGFYQHGLVLQSWSNLLLAVWPWEAS